MNKETYNKAQEAYNSGNIAEALELFTNCLQDGTEVPAEGEMGLLYHRIGNCLMKLRDHTEAIHAYTQAASDSSYEAIGQVILLTPKKQSSWVKSSKESSEDSKEKSEPSSVPHGTASPTCVALLSP